MMHEEEYAEGMEARHCGLDLEDCPYPLGVERNAWLDGYISAAHDVLMGEGSIGSA